jgi:hypothetical protein
MARNDYMEQELHRYTAMLEAQEGEIAQLKGELKYSNTQIEALSRELRSREAIIEQLIERLAKISKEPGYSKALPARAAAALQAPASESDSDAIKRIWQNVQTANPYEYFPTREPLSVAKQSEDAGMGRMSPPPEARARASGAPQAGDSGVQQRAWQAVQAGLPFENLQEPLVGSKQNEAAGTGLWWPPSPRTPESPESSSFPKL